MSDLLACIERAGGQGVLDANAPRSEREAIAVHLGALRAQGHAIIADEVIESGETTGDLRIWHYLSCRACKKGVV